MHLLLVFVIVIQEYRSISCPLSMPGTHNQFSFIPECTYIGNKYLASFCEIGCCRCTVVQSKMCCCFSFLLRCLPVLHSAPWEDVAGRDRWSVSPRKWWVCVFCGRKKEERCFVWGAVLFFLVGDVWTSRGQDFSALSQSLLYSWTRRQGWVEGLDVLHVLTLNRGHVDDGSFLRNNSYGDGRSKCC